MSINSALLAGVSGLRANSSAMAAISDNIANVNTNAYKRSEAEFLTLVTNRSRSGSYNAGGVTTATRRYISQEGQLEQSVNSTDLGIKGQGFFVVTEKAEGVMATDTRSFTRLGSFEADALGYLRNSAGLYLQGWAVDRNGDVTRDPSDLSRLRSINVTAIGGTAEPTTRVTINANLNAATVKSPAVAAGEYDPTAPDDPSTPPSPWPPTIPKWRAAACARTSASRSRSWTPRAASTPVQMSFLRGSEPNRWFVEIHATPADQLVGSAHSGQIAYGEIVFTPDGRYDPVATAALGSATPAGVPLFGDPNLPVINILPSSVTAPPSGSVAWATDLGVNGQQVRIDLDQAAGGLTLLNSQSEPLSIGSNGTAFGALDTIEIDENGYVTAEFDNGVTRRIAQVAIATFANPDALRPVSNNAYRVSLESGVYNLKAPGTGGAGEIAPSTLETSTVDLSLEFTGLITTQRAYSASSKIITTADEMMEELLRIKR
jgi:flagellar hook protein FlgE